jgi:hypothetical protein
MTKVLHQIVGVIVVIIFLLTGQYMGAYFPGLYQSNEALRMMYRSTHIYILLAGLLNIGIGTYLTGRKKRWRLIMQLVGSSLVIIGPLMLIGAFFYEPTGGKMERPITLPAMIFLLAGTLLHMLSGVGEIRNQPPAKIGLERTADQ